MRTLVALLFSLTLAAAATAQPITKAPAATDTHPVSPASTNNVFELVVVNTTGKPLHQVQVIAREIPAWLELDLTTLSLNHIDPDEEVVARFHFDVDEQAPIDDLQRVQFSFLASGEVLAERTFSLQVEAPKELVLHANYPNPFNPVTTLAYDLPQAAHVTIRVYNLLGQEVTTLVNEARPAGSHDVSWNAQGFATGLYIYVLSMRGADDQITQQRRTMMLVK